jgi:hypothetical protein
MPVEKSMRRAVLALSCIVLASGAAEAQGTPLERARFLLKVGHPEPALVILESLPETPAVLQGRAQAHVMLASQVPPAGRCEHLRRAIGYASMVSAQGIVEFARRRFRDEGCQIAPPAS